MPYAAEKQATCLQRRGGRGSITMVNLCRPSCPTESGATHRLCAASPIATTTPAFTVSPPRRPSKWTGTSGSASSKTAVPSRSPSPRYSTPSIPAVSIPAAQASPSMASRSPRKTSSATHSSSPITTVESITHTDTGDELGPPERICDTPEDCATCAERDTCQDDDKAKD